MNKDAITVVLNKHLLQTIEGLDAAQILPQKSMKELGANSLDIVEIVSATMRELRIKIPRSELSKLNNIGELVDLLHRSAGEAKATA